MQEADCDPPCLTAGETQVLPMYHSYTSPLYNTTQTALLLYAVLSLIPILCFISHSLVRLVICAKPMQRHDYNGKFLLPVHVNEPSLALHFGHEICKGAHDVVLLLNTKA
jgi:hypothetical protein